MSAADRYIAVFGDTHGHLRLMFQLCRLWQLNSGRHLAGILQCGDLGFFPDASRLDRATQRFARNDPEELGFAEYFALPQPARADPWLDRTLNGDPESLQTVNAPVIFCHGNHEDFASLEAVTCGSTFSAVDVFERLWFLRSGETADVAGVRVGAIGGAPENGESRDEVCGQHVSRRAVNRLKKCEFDVLITHGGPRGIGGETDQWGSALIAGLITCRQPAIHVFGHHTNPIAPAVIGRTQSVWLNDTNFEQTRGRQFRGPLESGCMAVLRWSSHDDHDLRIVDDDWFRRMAGVSWWHY